MSYSAIQHSDDRWGIYFELELLATIGSKKTCDHLLYCLNAHLQKKLSKSPSSKKKKGKSLVKT